MRHYILFRQNRASLHGNALTSYPSMAVIVPTYRRPAALLRCLEGLGAQTLTPSRIVIAVRDSDSETRQAVARVQGSFPTLEVADVKIPGQIAAIEAAVAKCSEDVIAHTDDDTVPRPDWLEKLARHYSSGVGGVGGRDVINGDEALMTPGVAVGHITWYGRLMGNHHLGSGPARSVHVLKGANMSLRRELWRPDKVLQGTGAQVHMEVSVCLHAKQEGWRLVYDPQSKVDHYPEIRFDDDQRGAPTLRAYADAQWNYAYGVARYSPISRLAPIVVYLLTVGYRSAPGPFLAISQIVELNVSDAKQLVRRCIVATVARASGLAAGMWTRLSAAFREREVDHVL